MGRLPGRGRRRPRRSRSRNAAFARGACQREVTTTTSRAPTRRMSLSALTAFPTVVRASGRRRARAASPFHAAAISSASDRVPAYARPAGEHDDVVPGRDLGGPREPCRADRVELVAAAVRVAEDDDARAAGRVGHEPRRRSQRKKSSVPIDGDDELDRLLPLQLRLAARALAHVHGDLLDPQPLRLQPQQRLDLGCAAHVRLGHHGHRLRVHGRHPARRIVERATEPHVHRLLQQADPEAAARRGHVALVVVALALGEARADGDVAGVRPHQLEQACELVGRVLAVGVDAPAERVAALGRLSVAGGDAGPKAAVLAERDDDRSRGAGDLGGRVRRAVVDHEHVGVGQDGERALRGRREGSPPRSRRG